MLHFDDLPMTIYDGHRTIQCHSIVQFVFEHIQIVHTVWLSIQCIFQCKRICVLGNAEQHLRLMECEIQCYCLWTIWLRVMVRLEVFFPCTWIIILRRQAILKERNGKVFQSLNILIAWNSLSTIYLIFFLFSFLQFLIDIIIVQLFDNGSGSRKLIAIKMDLLIGKA